MNPEYGMGPRLEMYEDAVPNRGDREVVREPANAPLYTFGMRDTLHQQIGSRLQIPKPYYDRMRSESPDLLAANVNEWLSRSDKSHMVRTLDGDGRAFLSSKYRPIDNIDILAPALTVFAEHTGMEIKSSEVTDSRMYLQAVYPSLEAEIPRQGRKVGDVVQAGIVLKNSEIGKGAVSLAFMVWRLICTNGMVLGKALSKYHVGRETVVDGAEQFFRDDTREMDDKAFLLKFRDTVSGMLAEETFNKHVALLTESTERKITGEPTKALEQVQRRFGLNDGEREGMMRHLIEGGDLSAWGVANAATALAHDSTDYDRSVEMEELGGKIIELPRKDWETIASAA